MQPSLHAAAAARPTTPPPDVAPARPRSLDALAALSCDELDRLYRSASVSTSLHAADGALPGRMLAVRSLPAALAAPLRRWAAAASFVWAGKTFVASSDSVGVGHNRVVVPGVLGRQNLFPFDTRFGASALDGQPTLVLDYDLAATPSYIRHIHDEIREVSPGLFLGPAMWKAAIGPRATERVGKTLLLWFALDGRRP